MISQVPRPFGELTHPSWRPEDVAFVVLAAAASSRQKLKIRRRCAIAPCAHPSVKGKSGITACRNLHSLVLPTRDAWNGVRKAFERLMGLYRVVPLRPEVPARSKEDSVGEVTLQALADEVGKSCGEGSRMLASVGSSGYKRPPLARSLPRQQEFDSTVVFFFLPVLFVGAARKRL